MSIHNPGDAGPINPPTPGRPDVNHLYLEAFTAAEDVFEAIAKAREAFKTLDEAEQNVTNPTLRELAQLEAGFSLYDSISSHSVDKMCEAMANALRGSSENWRFEWNWEAGELRRIRTTAMPRQLPAPKDAA